MPCLSIQTNVELPAASEKALLASLSRAAAEHLGKPEDYMMVTIGQRQRIIFAGSDAPAAFLTLQSIGLPAAKLNALTAAICELMAKHTGIPANRVYTVFANVDAKHWGFDSSTFA